MNAEEYAEILRENERSRERLRARMALARQVFASLDGVTPSALRTLAVGLSFAPEPLRGLSQPFESWADTIARDLSSNVLAELGLARVLRRMVLDPD